MTDLPHRALLPAGFHDLLPPDAAHEAAIVERLVAFLASHGYDRVKPPLVEFEDSLLSGVGAAMAGETFRLMDPLSQQVMAVRADTTPQAVRLARYRLAAAPRPLRLCYAGQVLRVRGSQLRPERQVAQVGAELIGAPEPGADAEAAILAVTALAAVGVRRLSIDLNIPNLVPALFAAHGLDAERAAVLRHALDRKDATQVAALGGPLAPALGTLIDATGPADRALDMVAGLDLPPTAAARLGRLRTVVEAVVAAVPGIVVTVDLVEHRGFEYHRGVSFSVFARGGRGELGRGGHYVAGDPDGDGEPATGFTLFVCAALEALPPPPAPRRVYLPCGTPPDAAARVRAAHGAAVAGLAPEADPVAEARRLGCAFVYADGAVRPIE